MQERKCGDACVHPLSFDAKRTEKRETSKWTCTLIISDPWFRVKFATTGAGTRPVGSNELSYQHGVLVAASRDTVLQRRARRRLSKTLAQGNAGPARRRSPDAPVARDPPIVLGPRLIEVRFMTEK